MTLRIPRGVQRAWDEWNIRVAVLVSLFFQVVLIFSATLRKRTGNRYVTMMIWSAYLLADWIAAFAVGLISNGQGDGCDKSRVDDDLAAFWAPFLLLHLGGPDTITAFSLEDNELWIRHLLGLVIQLVAVVYVFTQSVSNRFWIPTVLLFVAGTIKYAERTRALYLACLGNFKDNMLPKPDAGPNYAQLMEEYSSKEAAQVPVEIEIVKEPEKGFRNDIEEEEELSKHPKKFRNDIEAVEHGHRLFKIFKGLLVDLMFSFHERSASRKFFFERDPIDAFRVMEVELNFMYDALYTKMVVVHRKIGYFFRIICSVLIAASLGQFASIHKHKIHRIDIIVTYTLLIGAVGLDLLAFFKLIFSDWTIVKLKKSNVSENSNAQSTVSENSWAQSSVSCIRERVSFDNKCRWSKSVSRHSLIRYCLKERFKWVDKAIDLVGIKEFLDEMKYKETKHAEDNLKKFIFEELKEKALKAKDSRSAREIFSARGDWILSHNSCHHIAIVSSVSEDVEYDESLLLWHIATELCYFTETDQDLQGRSDDDKNRENYENREISRLLSEYMLYLLVMRPTMMSAVAGIGQIRFQDTCEEAKKFFRRGQSKSALEGIVKLFSMQKLMNLFKKSSESNVKRSEACGKLLSVNTVVRPVEVKGDRSKSLLFDACMLAKDLTKMKPKRKWEIMSKVWVELLCYAATHCRANTHAQNLSKGGELITFVWLLMAHFGLGEQFRIEAGHARAKLIVGK